MMGKKIYHVYINETQFGLLSSEKIRSQIKKSSKPKKQSILMSILIIKVFSADIKYLYQDIDIYDNEIFFLSNKFLSPVSATAPIMYRYYIIDTSLGK